ncbi:MAG TPA: UDP-N-acetylmuramoyl-L-alanyl-D-glutamate--2,6-diaminopimelate ligase [Vicinamibacterales bacterium]|nr:UDP-N-acetylmuramoyl-L-alanyl-D-glutamate--2,6-diaminopimelate ligase [Vicinamibacterales bacterium]
MKLADVQRTVGTGAGQQPPISGIAYDSRTVLPGQVFVALKGVHADGAQFARDAVRRGAIAVVAEQPLADLGVPLLQVADARLAMAELAADFYGHPSERMRVVGITGTNGKTTTAHLVASIFEADGMKCGVIGTVAHRIGSDVRASAHTTPEAPDVQALLREMADKGCAACAMEVSSHALAQRRVDAMTFSAGVFTNLTRDHLDFHHDMETYFQAKRRLFEMLPPTAPALINMDDPRGAAIVEASPRPVTYAINRAADITPGPLSFSMDGLSFDIRTPRGTLQARSKLVGRPNVYNILAAVSTGVALDLPFDAIEKGLQTLDAVPGRFEVVSSPRDAVTVVVDYAHTDDALRNLLETARPLARGRVITVFGCGGDRDRTKRPLMGAVASRLSDVLVITSDNPRHEDPARIIEEIQRGITADTRKSDIAVFAIVDRRTAIAKAIDVARPGDLVLIAGKGHEKYQILGNEHVPFDDAAVARELLGRRRTNSGVV